MKINYNVVWTDEALEQLNSYVVGLINQFEDVYNAQLFFESVIDNAEKLSFLANTYRFKREIVIKKYYKLSFSIIVDTVYIFSFRDMRRINSLH